MSSGINDNLITKSFYSLWFIVVLLLWGMLFTGCDTGDTTTVTEIFEEIPCVLPPGLCGMEDELLAADGIYRTYNEEPRSGFGLEKPPERVIRTVKRDE